MGRDRSDSCAIAPPPTPQLRRAPVCRRRRLWLAGAGYALFITTLAVGNGFVAPERGVRLNMLGHDFLPFYTAGTLVREGRHRELYHLDAIRAAEHRIADMVDLPLGVYRSDDARFFDPASVNSSVPCLLGNMRLAACCATRKPP